MISIPARRTSSMISATTPAVDSLSAMITTVSSGLSIWSRSIIGRTSRMSTRRRSIQMSPFSRMAIIKLPESRPSAVWAVGLNTVMPASLMNDVVMMKKISRFVVKSSIGARSIPVSSVSGAWRRDCIAASLSRLLCRGERDVVNAAEMHLVDDLDQRARRRACLRQNQYTAIRIHGAHPLDVGAHRPNVDSPVVHPNFAGLENLDLDALGVFLLRLLERSRAVDLETGLFDEDRGDDEEDQQIRDEIQHRRQVDAGLFLIRP